mmetsp:Transcript_86002/g.143179  ORF Transcript_86002/g.143179 Transcript_86002/m.143179 type:complete len:82 (-) Transcript_86002:114-359(-)
MIGGGLQEEHCDYESLGNGPLWVWVGEKAEEKSVQSVQAGPQPLESGQVLPWNTAGQGLVLWTRADVRNWLHVLAAASVDV